MKLIEAVVNISGDGRAVLQALSGTAPADVQIDLNVSVAARVTGRGRTYGFREMHMLPPITDGTPEHTLRAVESLERQSLISPDERSEIEAVVKGVAVVTKRKTTSRRQVHAGLTS